MDKCLGKPVSVIADEYGVSRPMVRKFAREHHLDYIGAEGEVYSYVFDDAAEELFRNRNTGRGRLPAALKTGFKSAAQVAKETGFSRELVNQFARKRGIPKDNGVYVFDPQAERAFLNRNRQGGRPRKYPADEPENRAKARPPKGGTAGPKKGK